MRKRPQCHSGGFTLIDLMMTLTIIAVMATVLIPRMGDGGRVRLIAGSRVLSSDIEMAQIMTISNPTEPIIVKFEPLNSRYWLAPASDPDNPIVRPGATQLYRVTFGQGRGRTANDVTFELTDITGDVLKFNEQGGVLDPTTAPQIKLIHGQRWIKLNVSTMTGLISETAGP